MTDNVYDGQNWATHSIAVWIANDESFYDTAANYAKLDETGEELRGYLTRLLFRRHELAYPELRRLTRDDLHTLGLVVGVGGLVQEGDPTPTREAFATVDWGYVRAELLG